MPDDEPTTEHLLDENALEAAAEALYDDKFPGLGAHYPLPHEPEPRRRPWFHTARVAITAYLGAMESPFRTSTSEATTAALRERLKGAERERDEWEGRTYIARLEAADLRRERDLWRRQ